MSINYFANLGSEYHLPKIRCSESSFPKRIGCQCNIPYILKWFNMLKVDGLSVILIGMFGVTKIVSKYTFLFKKKKLLYSVTLVKQGAWE